MLKLYLGDSVYVRLEHGQLILTTEDVFITNRIFLAPAVMEALIRYWKEQTFCTKEENPKN